MVRAGPRLAACSERDVLDDGLVSEVEALAWRDEAWRGHEDIAVPEDDEFEDEAAFERE